MRENSRNSSTPMDARRPSETGSVFGGSLSIKGGVNNAMQNEILQKKLKKRLQLKNLIDTKFRNKYCLSAEIDESLNKLIQDEIDRLFSLEHFDERDLVQVDVKVRDFIKNKKESKDIAKSEKSTVK